MHYFVNPLSISNFPYLKSVLVQHSQVTSSQSIVRLINWIGVLPFTVALQMESDMTPTKSFFCRARVVSCDKGESVSGTGPEKPLLSRASILS
mmetsp:Transcript_12062/g.17854  ORF Transcript_12062/g.17854 Transcript_12062/m.17854 type:complete len:93 (+) Transcript_12062:210-488(+)